MKAPFTLRARAMSRIAVRMMFHDRAKFVGTLAGAVFAVILAVQQFSVLLGLLDRNTMLVHHSGADLWIVPPRTELLQPGQPLGESVLVRARTTPGVAQAEPLIVSGAALKTPDGGSEPVQLVGVAQPSLLGGPWHMVAGEPGALREPDTIIFEDSQREKYGGLNLGSIRELNHRQVRAGGFTWGLLPFGPAYAFGDIDLVRDLTRTPSNRTTFVLVRVKPDANPAAVHAALQARVPEVLVVTTDAYVESITRRILKEQLGFSFGLSTAFGLVIGLVIVALSMFSAVLDNLKEFGTLKAIGCTNTDLTLLLICQSVLYGLLGSLLGLGLVTWMVDGIRRPQLSPIVPGYVLAGIPFIIVTLCVTASLLALRRVRKLEPGMVFR